MSDTNKNTAVSALSIVSLVEFLEAYPVNLTVSGDKLLVSNRDIDFTVEIIDSKLLIDGIPATEENLFQIVSPNDDSVLEDWLLHVSLFEAVESDTRAEEDMPHMSDDSKNAESDIA